MATLRGLASELGNASLFTKCLFTIIILAPLNPPPSYTREIGTMWQIGVLTGKPCTFLVKNRSFSAFWHYKNKGGLSKGLDVNWHIPPTCLDSSRMWFSTGIYSINRASAWLWLKTQETPARMCTVSRSEHQFATLCLFHAPTTPPSQNSKVMDFLLNFY